MNPADRGPMSRNTSLLMCVLEFLELFVTEHHYSKC